MPVSRLLRDYAERDLSVNVSDPNFFNEPSGCTAVSTVLTTDGRIICVRLLRSSAPSLFVTDCPA